MSSRVPRKKQNRDVVAIFWKKRQDSFCDFRRRGIKIFTQPKSFEAPIRFLQAKKFLNDRECREALYDSKSNCLLTATPAITNMAN